ncbi:MAG: hypothetical protein ACI8Z1_002510 [Candidatus Azotimanducaceae bacterium]
MRELLPHISNGITIVRFRLVLPIISKDAAILGGGFAVTTIADMTIADTTIAETALAGITKIQPDFLGKVTAPVQTLLLGIVLINLSFADLIPLLVLTVLSWLVSVGILLDGMSNLWIRTDRLAKDPRWSEIVT